MGTLAGAAWPACSSFPASLLELVVLVPELTQTSCGSYSCDLSPTTGVSIDCGHPVAPMATCKTVGEV